MDFDIKLTSILTNMANKRMCKKAKKVLIKNDGK